MSLPTDTETEARQTIETVKPKSGLFTLRAAFLGLMMVVLMAGLTQPLSIRYAVADVGGGAPAPGPTNALFFYVLWIAPLLARWNPRIALSRGELLLIYAMMIVAGPIMHVHAIGYLIPHTVSPLYYNAQEPGWALFRETLPVWFGPDDPNAVLNFFRGGEGAVPWRAWWKPMFAWSVLLIALFFVTLCINALMRKQWMENERLNFPLAAIPLALTEGLRTERASGSLGPPGGTVSILKRPLFWLGLATPLLMQLPRALHRLYPVVPEMPLREIVLIPPRILSPPWNGFDGLEFSLIFWLIGVVYLLPKELAFSGWFFHFVGQMENVAAIWWGVSGESPSVYSNTFPALYAQGAGATFALTGIVLWTARRHLWGALRKAFRNDPAVDDSGEFLSYRTAVLGALFGTAFLIGWLWLAGMRLWVAALLISLILSYFFLFGRIRAETGLGMGVILWPKMLDEVMITVVGARYLRLSDITVLYAIRWLYFGSATGSVMACQLESFKLADVGGLSPRPVGKTLALVATITVPLAFAWTLTTFYSRGFETMPLGMRSTNMVGSQIYWAYQNMVEAWNTAAGPEWSGILAMAGGGLVATGLSLLRARFLWFPLHPVGYIAANAWGMHINWASFFIGWLLNTLITRYGGLALYRRLLPVFLGFIVGDMLHIGLWGLVAWITGTDGRP